MVMVQFAQFDLRNTEGFIPAERAKSVFQDLRNVKRALVDIQAFLDQAAHELPTDNEVTGELAFAASYANIALLHLLKARWALAERAGLEGQVPVKKDPDPTEALFRRIAEAARDQSHHAAVCAPLHGKTPEELIMSINIDSVIAPFLSEVSDDEDEIPSE